MLIEAIGTLIALLRIPSDSKNDFLWGYSAYRLVMIGALAILIVSLILFFFRSIKQNHFDKQISQFIFLKEKVFNFIIFFLTIVFLIGWIFSWLPAYRFGSYHLVYERLKPFFQLTAIFSLQGIVWLKIKKTGWRWQDFIDCTKSGRYNIAIIFLIFFIVVWGIIAFTGWGIKPDTVHWNDVGIPILGFQLFLIFWIGFLFRFIEENQQLIEKFQSIIRIKKLDVLICVLIWAFTSFVWIIQPQQGSFFAPGPYPPNDEYYPFSDAAGYDIDAQFALIGQGLNNRHDVDKPLYSTFLVFLHLLGGQDFQKLVYIQILFLSIFSVILYCIGKTLHSRSAGIVASLLIILHGINSITSSRMILSANPTLFLSEYPTAICLSLMTFFSILWMKNPQKNLGYGMITWGMLGLSTLIRHNVWIILPLFFLLALIKAKSGWRNKLVNLLMLTLVFFISITPWMWRTTQVMKTPLYFLGPIQEVLFKKRIDVNLEQNNIKNQVTENECESDKVNGTKASCKFLCQHDLTVIQSETTPIPDQTRESSVEPTPTPDTPEPPYIAKTPSLLYVLLDGTYDDGFRDVYFIGQGWRTEPGNYYEGAIHVSDEIGDHITVWFNGEAFEVIYSSSPDGGELEVKLDGEIIASIDQFSEKPESQLRWKSGRFEKNVHKVELTHRRGQRVTFDGVVFHSYNSFIFPNGIQLPSVQKLAYTLSEYVPSHFFHNFVTTTLTLPMSFVYDDLEHVIKNSEGVWAQDWDGSINITTGFLLFLYLFVLVNGISSAMSKWRIAGLMPMLILLFYFIGLAVARTSGGRYIVAVEWIVFLYLALGLVHISSTILRFWRNDSPISRREVIENNPKGFIFADKKKYYIYVSIAAIFFLIGSTPVIAEHIFPKRYADYSKEEVLNILDERGSLKDVPYEKEQIQQFLNDDNSYLWMGRALYPKFFFADQGEYSSSKEMVKEYPRLVFVMIGGSDDKSITGLLPTNQFPDYFPNASDVIVFGCRDSFSDVLSVVVLDDKKGDRVYSRSPAAPLVCPIREPICDDNRKCQ